MGFFSGLANTFGFGDGGAGDAVRQREEGLVKARQELQTQFDASKANFDPFLQAGFGGLEGQIQGSTAGGLDQRLGEIFGSDSFANLRDERERAVRGQLSAAGLNRSGTAVNELADLSAQLGFDIEGLLANRQGNLAGQGFNTASNLANLGQTFGQNTAGIQNQVGQAQASGTLAANQAQSAGLGNLLNAASGGISGFAGGPSGTGQGGFLGGLSGAFGFGR